MQKVHFPIPQEKIASFCKKHHIEKMSLFGSVLTPQFKSSSDIDFLVVFDPHYHPGLFNLVDMEEELSEIVGRTADLRTPGDLSRFFRDEVVEQAHPIYAES